MRIGLFGFGRTGRSVASVLLENDDVTLSWVIRKSKTLHHRSVPEFLGVEADEQGLIFTKDEFEIRELLDSYPVDVIIDFSSEEALRYYGAEAARRGIIIVSAISSYSAQTIRLLKRLSHKTRVLWSPNITIGINFLIVAAKALKKIAPYADIEIVEEHFAKKKETSGTAKVIARSLEKPIERINSIRAGGIIGRHEILFGFPHQTVRLSHESISREAFGNGVLFAAMNLASQPNGLYTMEDLLAPYFQ